MFFFFLIVLILFVVIKKNKVSKNVKNVGYKYSNSIICDIIISFSLFWLLVNTNTIINIFENSSGNFMVYIESDGIIGSTDFLVFYDSDCKEVKTVEMNKRGRLNINSDEKQIIVRYNNYVVHFDYCGNEIDNNIPLDSSVTEIYTPYSNFSEINTERNFWGYEYLSVIKNNIEQNIYLDNIFYLRKLFMALFISAIIFALLRNIPYILFFVNENKKCIND